jgi:N-acetylmuramoyl-L-alanine amidase
MKDMGYKSEADFLEKEESQKTLASMNVFGDDGAKEPAKSEPKVKEVKPEIKPEPKPEIKPEPKPDTVVTKPAVPVEEQQATVVEMPVVAMEQTVPVQETPVQTVPVQTVPAQTTPVQTVPVQTTPAQPETAPAPQKARPVFKLQILTSGTKLKAGDARLKGRKDAECYKEGGLWKYTVGASEDYNAVQRLRKELAKTFPQAFVVAFLNGQRVNTNEALELYRKQK